MADRGRWALVDTDSNLYMGDHAGPFLYAKKSLAFEAAASMTSDLGWPFGRIRPCVYGNDAIRMRDEVPFADNGSALSVLPDGSKEKSK